MIGPAAVPARSAQSNAHLWDAMVERSDGTIKVGTIKDGTTTDGMTTDGMTTDGMTTDGMTRGDQGSY